MRKIRTTMGVSSRFNPVVTEALVQFSSVFLSTSETEKRTASHDGLNMLTLHSCASRKTFGVETGQLLQVGGAQKHSGRGWKPEEPAGETMQSSSYTQNYSTRFDLIVNQSQMKVTFVCADKRRLNCQFLVL